MVADAYLVSPGIFGSRCRPGSAQRVRVCDMWRSAVTCLLACRLTSLSCRGFTRKDSSPEGRLCRPDYFTVQRGRAGRRAGGGAAPLPLMVRLTNDLAGTTAEQILEDDSI